MAGLFSDRTLRALRFVAVAGVATLMLGIAAPGGVPGDRDAARSERMEALRRAVESLQGKELGVLGELERLDAELRLRRAVVEDADARIGSATTAADGMTAELARLHGKQADRRKYLMFRLRELYKRGAGAPLRILAGDAGSIELLRSARYAAYLGERDVEVMRSFRSDADRLVVETQQVVDQRKSIEVDRAQAEEARAALAAVRAERARYLAELRKDLSRSQEALRELEGAAEGLVTVAGTAQARPLPSKDLAELRGTLEWPVSGKVRIGFGTTVHPEFKTVIPHPGLDIDAAEGTAIHAAAEGSVAWSGSLRGYGLTAILDHGGGLLSVYAHAAVLLVEAGDHVIAGEAVGKVGDTGSLKGPYLYFELRRDGKPLDPIPWLRRR